MNEWIKWEGGECPIDADTVVDVEIDGIVCEYNNHADEWNWGKYECGNITAYRVVEEAKQDKSTKNTNPKDILGSDKLPLHLWPTTATATGSLALLDGMLKYGRSNWRVAGVRASIYIDAAIRHIYKYLEGEDFDPDSGVPHLGHALACLAILVDAKAAGKLNDDRLVDGGYPNLIKELTPHVSRLKELHKEKSPKHYTIEDNNGALGDGNGSI